MRNFFIAGLLLAIGIVCGSKLLLANGEGIRINPSLKEVVLEEGTDHKEFIITLTNDTTSTVTLELEVQDFGVLDETGGVAFLGNESDKTYGLVSWIDVNKQAITLRAQESENVSITIRNNDELSPGGHYGAVLFKLQSTVENKKNSDVKLNQIFSSLIFVRKIGGEIYELDLVGQKFKKNIWRFPSYVDLRFKNQGNIHTQPQGTVEISDWLYRDIAKGSINSENGRILPASYRVFKVSLQDNVRLKLPGRYNAIITYEFESQQNEKRVNFIYVPIWFSLTLVIFPMTVYVIFKTKRKRRNLKH